MLLLLHGVVIAVWSGVARFQDSSELPSDTDLMPVTASFRALNLLSHRILRTTFPCIQVYCAQVGQQRLDAEFGIPLHTNM